jgi:hypothetical protein
LATLGVLSLAGGVAYAGGPLDISINASDGSGAAADSKFAKFTNAADAIVNRTGVLGAIAGRPYVANLAIGHTKQLLTFTGDGSGTNLTITNPRTGESKVFNAASPDALASQVNDFLQKSLNNAFGAFQRQLNSRTGIGVSDGNPLAATAVLANDAFNHFGIAPVAPNNLKAGEGFFDFGVGVEGGNSTTGGISGDYGVIDFTLGGRFNDHIGLYASVPIEYRDVKGTDTFIGGLNFGLPITVVQRAVDADGWAWDVTPWGSVGGGINEKILSGGGIYGGGGTSDLTYRTGKWTFRLADQISYDTGFAFTYQKVKYDTPVVQWLLKNGLGASYQATTDITIDGTVSYTNFLSDAYVKDYVTPTLGASWHFGDKISGLLRVGYVGNYGDHFSSTGGMIDLHLFF